jgi:cysteine desulfuration protein SufE
MTDIAAELAEIEDEFALFSDWEERYQHVIDLGKTLAPLTPEEHNAATKVPGCVSQVWLVTERAPGPVLLFRGDSDAHIVRGLVAIVLRLYSGRSPAEILSLDAAAVMQRLGLDGALTPQRSNGFKAMIGRIRREAEQALTA